MLFQLVLATPRAKIERLASPGYMLLASPLCQHFCLRDKQDVREVIPLESHKERGEKNQQGAHEDRIALYKPPRSSTGVPNSRLTFFGLWTFRTHGKAALVCEMDNCTVPCNYQAFKLVLLSIYVKQAWDNIFSCRKVYLNGSWFVPPISVGFSSSYLCWYTCQQTPGINMMITIIQLK